MLNFTILRLDLTGFVKICPSNHNPHAVFTYRIGTKWPCFLPGHEKNRDEFVSLFYDPLIFMNPRKMRVKVNFVPFYYFPVLARSCLDQITNVYFVYLHKEFQKALDSSATPFPPLLCSFLIFFRRFSPGLLSDS